MFREDGPAPAEVALLLARLFAGSAQAKGCRWTECAGQGNPEHFTNLPPAALHLAQHCAGMAPDMTDDAPRFLEH